VSTHHAPAVVHVVLQRSAGPLAARRRAAFAGLGAGLAMRHFVGAAFLRAPIADVRAQLAELLGERTVAGDRVAAEPADRGTLDTAGRTGGGARLAGHVRKAVATIGRALVARGDAVLFLLVEMVTPDVFPFRLRNGEDT